jgi:aromatic-L-amino-acid decarboxylase
MSPEEFRALGHQLVDWIADHRQRVHALPVMSQVSPGWVKSQLPNEPPSTPTGLQALTDELDRTIVPGLSHFNHPSFFAFFPGNVDLSSVLADMISTGLGVNGITWQACPAITEVEEVMMDWLRQMVGLPSEFRGVIQDTASTGTLVALLCARERASGFAVMQQGLQGVSRPLTVYVSADAHSSVEKAALLAGFGKAHVRSVPTDHDHKLDVRALRDQMAGDARQGFRPAAIVATAGTTATCAFDPIDAIADVAHEHGAWLHVDAAMAGSGMIAPELRTLWSGVHRADSLLFNPHKWLGAALDCSAFYVRDPRSLTQVMSTQPTYLVDAAVQDPTAVTQYRDWGIPLGRRFRALKLWLLIRSEGVQGLQQRIRRDVAHAKWLEATARATPDWQVKAPVHLQTVCVQHRPASLLGSPQALNDHNERWANDLNRSGKAYVTTTVVKGERIVRVSIGALQTEMQHVQELWSHMQHFAQRTQQR